MKLTLVGVGLALGVLANSCIGNGDQRDGSPAGLATLGEVPADVPQPIRRSIEDEFERIAAAVPGFGGLYHTNDETVVNLVDLTREREAIAYIEGLPELARANEGKAIQLRIASVKYSFAELQSYRDALLPIMDKAGVIFLDLDEAENAVVLGITDYSIVNSIITQFQRIKVPTDVVRYELTEPIVPMSQLNDSIRPAPGAMRIEVRDVFGNIENYCTITMNAAQSSFVHFLTASHCTAVQGGVEGSLYYQPNQPDFDEGRRSRLIGHEVKDPLYFSCSGRKCRYADVALIRYENSALAEGGTVARTTFSDPVQGSILISSSNPRFTINGEWSFPYHGEVLEKVGYPGGWTRGPVDRTCADFNQAGGFRFLCQYRVVAGIRAGDSGSPILAHNQFGSPNNAAIIGIAHSSDCSIGTTCTRLWMSSYDAIEDELGNLNPWW